MHKLTDDELNQVQEALQNRDWLKKEPQSPEAQAFDQSASQPSGPWFPTLPETKASVVNGDTDDGLKQPSLNGFREPTWWVRKSPSWMHYGTPDEPRIAEASKGFPEFRSFIEPCIGLDCAGYLLEHSGPNGSWSSRCECPYHGFKWARLHMTDVEKRQDIQARLYAAEIPARFRNWTFDSYPLKGDNFNWCYDFANAGIAGRLSLVLMGPFGTGKTGLAISILRKHIEEHGGRGLFANVATLFEEMKALFGKEGETSAYLQRATNVPLLILDDLGAEKPSDWVTSQLYHIINTRLANERPTVITTNLTEQGLIGQVGERTFERLKPPWYSVIMVDGPNLRDMAA